MLNDFEGDDKQKDLNQCIKRLNICNVSVCHCLQCIIIITARICNNNNNTGNNNNNNRN